MYFVIVYLRCNFKSRIMKTFNIGMMPHDGIRRNELRNHIMKNEKEYIEKQEILDAIREGLLEIKEARLCGRELMDAEDLLNEL